MNYQNISHKIDAKKQKKKPMRRTKLNGLKLIRDTFAWNKNKGIEKINPFIVLYL